MATDRPMKKRDARPLHNCIGCGRGTRAMDHICVRCRGGRANGCGCGVPPRNQGHAVQRPGQDMPIEDDYSEDAGPDSVDEDGLYW